MTAVPSLVKRNVKLFFKDKGMFFTSLITPAILLVLYVTFLGEVYRDSFRESLPDFISTSDSIIDGIVAGQLMSSILAVSAVTVAFCSNFLSVQDKANGTLRDFLVSPVSSLALSVGYYAANLISTMLICLSASAVCLLYVAAVGWYMSLADVLLLLLDVLLAVLFGNALSSLINTFLSTQGHISAVGTIVSSGYGFICGAYMPISSFGKTLQGIFSLLPGTYATSLIRNHSMRGALSALKDQGVPDSIMSEIRKTLDCDWYLFDRQVSQTGMYIIVLGFTLLLLGAFVLLRRHVNSK